MRSFLHQTLSGTYWAVTTGHRWALSPISVISDIGLSLISELPISDWESGVRHYIGYRNKVLSDIQYPTSHRTLKLTVAQCYSARLLTQWIWVRYCRMNYFFSSMSDIGMSSDVYIGTLPISELHFSVRHFCLRYRNNRCRCRMSDIADIEIDVDAHLCHWRGIFSIVLVAAWFINILGQVSGINICL